jgi:hypothetical protein
MVFAKEMGMKRAALALLMTAFSLSGHLAWAHGDQRLGVEPVNEGTFPAGTVGYDFQILDLVKRSILADTDFEISHEELVHVFVYDPALKHLQHVHAKYANGVWHTDVPLAQDGDYWIWAEGQLASDHTTGYGSSRLTVVGGDPEDTSAPDVHEVRTGADGTSQLALTSDPVVKGKEVMLGVTFSRTDGTTPDITPYLGETGHAIMVSDDGDWLTHSHVMADNTGMLMLHATFPEAGNYRVWVQFMDGGVLKMVALAVAVADSP